MSIVCKSHNRSTNRTATGNCHASLFSASYCLQIFALMELLLANGQISISDQRRLVWPAAAAAVVSANLWPSLTIHHNRQNTTSLLFLDRTCVFREYLGILKDYRVTAKITLNNYGSIDLESSLHSNVEWFIEYSRNSVQTSICERRNPEWILSHFTLSNLIHHHWIGG